MKNCKNDSAVSSIIGVILMVVIVTVLASFTALFVFLYLNTVGQVYLVDLTVKRIDTTTIEISNHGGPNIRDLNTNSTYPFVVYIDGVERSSIPPTQLTDVVGSHALYNANVGQKISIVGNFANNKKQVIFESYV
jgi:hypothetical protein